MIAACVTGAVAAADHLTYLVGSIQNADDQVSLTLDVGDATRSPDPARAWELKFLCTVC
jgi:hypothetical protein